MSQAGIINVAGGGGGGSPVQTITTDDGSVAVPVANNINLFARDNTVNNDNGIQTNNDPDGSQNVFVEITNRLQGQTTTLGAVTADLFTIDLGGVLMANAAGTYKFSVEVAAFEPTTPAGAIWNLTGGVRTTGPAGTATIIGTPDKDFDKEAALNACDVNFIVSGNDFIVRLTGTAGLNVRWGVVALYVFRGA